MCWGSKVSAEGIRGSFAVVRKAVRKKTGEEVAVKVFKRYPPPVEQACSATLGEDDELALKNEVEILTQASGRVTP